MKTLDNQTWLIFSTMKTVLMVKRINYMLQCDCNVAESALYV